MSEELTEREALIALLDATWQLVDQLDGNPDAGLAFHRLPVVQALYQAEGIVGRLPPIPKPPKDGWPLDPISALVLERQEGAPTHGILAQQALTLIERFEKGMGWLRFWGGVERGRREDLADRLQGLLAEAIRAAEFAQGPLPDSDICICRKCHTVHLPSWPWGPAGYSCCGMLWSYHRSFQPKTLPTTFWTKNRPGERARGTQPNPMLDGRGRPETGEAKEL